jgi:hypothetical protein
LSNAFRAALLVIAALMLQSCEPSSLILHAQIIDGKIVITFFKRGFLGREYRVRPCVGHVVLEGRNQRILWQISAPPTPPHWRPCRELDTLRFGEAPNGFDVEVPLDLSAAPPLAMLYVGSQDGSGEIRIWLSRAGPARVRPRPESQGDGVMNWSGST